MEIGLKPSTSDLSSMKDINPESRRTTMPIEFNQVGITVEQLMDTVRENLIPDDDSSYQVTYTNKPKSGFVEVSVEKISPVEGVENQVVASMNVGYAIMSTGKGAFDLECYWITQVTYPPGEINA